MIGFILESVVFFVFSGSELVAKAMCMIDAKANITSQLDATNAFIHCPSRGLGPSEEQRVEVSHFSLSTKKNSGLSNFNATKSPILDCALLC